MKVTDKMKFVLAKGFEIIALDHYSMEEEAGT